MRRMSFFRGSSFGKVVVSCQLSVISYQLSVISYQWSVVSGQWSVVSPRPTAGKSLDYCHCFNFLAFATTLIVFTDVPQFK